jgi:hypothetical protein
LPEDLAVDRVRPDDEGMLGKRFADGFEGGDKLGDDPLQVVVTRQ